MPRRWPGIASIPISPSRRIASTLATVVVLVSYLGSNVTGMITSLDSLQALFLFHYCEASADALENGQQFSDTVVLLAAALVALGLAVLSFQRRNLTVGAWPWTRGKIPSPDKKIAA